MPPLAVTLKTHEEATAILRRAGVCRGTQLQVNFKLQFSAANFLVLISVVLRRQLLFTGNGEYDASDEEAVGTASPFPKPGDLDS